uniref:Uncharacterized protein n=1 Tax=Cannabis sativa TaxID=3483 RepID=A0A803PUZ8_CANSA
MLAKVLIPTLIYQAPFASTSQVNFILPAQYQLLSAQKYAGESDISCSGVGSDLVVADPHQYRSNVGAIQYAVITRPKVSYAVNKVSQFMHNPPESHLKVVKKILKYLKGTLDHGLHLKPCSSLTLTCFCDADWASDPDDRRSTSCFCVCLGSNLVSWSSKKRKIVSRSSTEIEYCSLANATTEIIWLQSFFGNS